MNSFDEWWNEVEGFSLRSERALDGLGVSSAAHLEFWMKACWNAAIEAAQEELSKEAYYWMDGRDDYGHSYPEQQIDSLKAK